MPLNLDIFKLPRVPEDRYRQRYLRTDVVRATFGIALIIVTLIAFIYRDHYFLGLSWKFYALLAARCGFVVFSVGVLAYLRKITDYRIYDRVIAVWTFLALTLNLVINLTRPSDYYLFVILDMVYLSLVYITLPSRLWIQMITCLYFSIGDVLIIALTKEPAVQPALFTIIFASILANGLGIVLGFFFSYYRKEDYLSIEQATRALNEVKTLSGFLPICSSCKKIRNDQGYWQAVEQYVKEHTEAQFTHGICPDCMGKFYGETPPGPPDAKS